VRLLSLYALQGSGNQLTRHTEHRVVTERGINPLVVTARLAEQQPGEQQVFHRAERLWWIRITAN
jgi:hypothetical protein